MAKRHDVAKHNDLARLLAKARRAEGLSHDPAPPDLGAVDLVPYRPEPGGFEPFESDPEPERTPEATRARWRAARDARLETRREVRRRLPAAVPRFQVWLERAPVPPPVEEAPEPEPSPQAPLPFAEPVLLGVRRPLPAHPLAIVTESLLEFYCSVDAPWRRAA